MLPSYFDYIFVHLRQKARLRPELSQKLLSTWGPNPARTWTRPEKPGPTYNSDQMIYPSKPNSERFNLILRHIFVMYQRYLPRLSDTDFQNEWFSVFYYLLAHELKLVPF